MPASGIPSLSYAYSRTGFSGLSNISYGAGANPDAPPAFILLLKNDAITDEAVAPRAYISGISSPIFGPGPATTIDFRQSPDPDPPDPTLGTTRTALTAPADETDTLTAPSRVRTTISGAPPGRPNRPIAAGRQDSIFVSWTAPSNSGPAIAGYDVQYRITGTEEFTVVSYGATVTQATITGLARGKFHEVQVRANNADGNGEWSLPARPNPRVYPNKTPNFDSGLPHNFDVAEGPSTGEALGDPYTANDDDGDTVTYTLEGEDSGVLAIGRTTGQIAVGLGYSLDFENSVDNNTDNVYIIEVVADDGHGAMVHWDVEITVTDVDEPPVVELSTSNPRVGVVVTATLTDPNGIPTNESWQWQRADDPSSPAWVDISGATSATYTVVGDDLGKALRAVVSYQGISGGDQEVRSAATSPVRAANQLPTFPSETATRSVPENTVAGVAIGLPIGATDADDDPLTYSLSGDDVSSFALNTVSGQISTSAALDFETRSAYQLTVSASDGQGGSDSIAVTIQVTNVNEPPDRMDRPTAAGGFEQITVNWSPPSNPGPTISGYDVQYRISGAETFDNTANFGSTATSGVITGLARGKYYEAQVRAKNTDGDGEWSLNADPDPRVNTNRPPEFDSVLPDKFSVAEGPVAGAELGEPYTADDPDGDTVTYTLEGEDAGVFAIGRTTGQIAVGVGYSLNFEDPADDNDDNVYIIVVVADDNHGLIVRMDLEITVTGIDEPGSVVISVTSPRVGDEFTATLTDPDGNPVTVTWQWQRADDPSHLNWVDINGATSATYTAVAADLAKVLRAVVRYQNEGGADQEVQSAATSAVRAANQVPAFPPDSAERSVPEKTVAGVAIGLPVGATDADDDPLTYTLSGDDAPSFKLNTVSGQISTSAALDFETKSTYQLTVSVTDGQGGSDSVAVTIQVTNVNEPPDRMDRPTATGGFERITVTWVPPSNPGPAISGYDVQHRISGAETFDNTADFGPTLTTGVVTGLARGKYYEAQVRAKNTDGDGEWSLKADPDPRVNTNRPPEFDSVLPDKFSVAEGPVAGAELGEPYTADDPDEDIVTYTLEGDDSAVLSVVRATGQIMVGVGFALDFEDPADANTDNVYIIEIVADDGHGLIVRMDLEITVTDIDEPGSLIISVSNPRVGWELAATLTDPDGNPATVTWKWQRADAPANPAWTNISGATSATYTVVATDLGKVLRATVSYQGVGGIDQEVQSAATSTVRAANRLPVFPSETTTRSVPEKTGSGVAIGLPIGATDADDDTLTYSLSGDDASSFTLNTASGQISTTADLDFETRSAYQLTVSVTDGEGGADSIAVTIQVTNVNEPPDQMARPTAVGGFEQITVNWSPPSNPGPAISGYDVQYRIRGAESFDNIASFGPTLTSGVITGLDRGKYYEAQVRAKNADGDGEWSLKADPDPRVNPNRAPEFGSDLPDKFNVPEGPTAGESLGDPYSAADPDGDTITYTLEGEDAGILAIGGNTGQIVVGVGFTLDFEDPADANADNVYVIEIVADDGHGVIVRMDLEITVTNVDEATVALSNTNPRVDSQLTATLSDPNGNPAVESWQWQRADDPAGPIWANISGATSATYTTVVADLGKVLRVTASYQSEDGVNQEVQSVSTSAVRDANQVPTFQPGSSERSVPENTADGTAIELPIGANDADDDTLVYSLSGNDASSFAIDSASGQISTSASLDFETKALYQVTVSVNDGWGGFTEVAVTIRVTNVNEPPDQMARPTAVGGFERITVNWNPPSNPGPNISGYDVQYRIRGTETFDNPANFDPILTTRAVTGLARGKYYEAQVRAQNADGDGEWSEPVEARVAPNEPPTFDPVLLPEFRVAEGPFAGEELGEPYTAADSDEDTVTYTLEGDDAGVLGVDPATGQIVVGEGQVLDYQSPADSNGDRIYVIEVVADDGEGLMVRKAVAITVVELEQPGNLNVPTNPQVGLELTAMLRDTEADPANEKWQWQRADQPVNERRRGADNPADPGWTKISGATFPEYTAVAADIGKILRVVVRYQGKDGVYKQVRSAATSVVRATNRIPTFLSESTTLSVDENVGSDVLIGLPIPATDADDDPLTYSMMGTDASFFGFNTNTGQISTDAALDFETKNTYQVTITVDDGHDGTDSVGVTIQVTDIDEPPDQMARPTATNGFEQISVTWETPSNPGPAISGYDVQYRIRETETADTTSFGPTITMGVINQLVRGSYYEVQVRATNAEGVGQWSDKADPDPRVNPNVSPKFDRSVLPAKFSVAEGLSAGDSLGVPYTASEDDGDPIVYSLDGVDSPVLGIDQTTGQIAVGAGFYLDFENPVDVSRDNIYVIEVIAEDGHGSSDRMDVEITVTNLDESDNGTDPIFPIAQPTRTPTPAPTATPTPTPTPTPTGTPSPTPTPTVTPTATPTPTPSRTPTPTPTPTVTPTPTPSPTPTPTGTPTPSPFPTPTHVGTPTTTLSPTPRPVVTPTPFLLQRQIVSTPFPTIPPAPIPAAESTRIPLRPRPLAGASAPNLTATPSMDTRLVQMSSLTPPAPAPESPLAGRATVSFKALDPAPVPMPTPFLWPALSPIPLQGAGSTVSPVGGGGGYIALLVALAIGAGVSLLAAAGATIFRRPQ